MNSLQQLQHLIADIPEKGGRLVLVIGTAERTMTFKPGLSRAKVDEILCRMADSMARELKGTPQ